LTAEEANGKKSPQSRVVSILKQNAVSPQAPQKERLRFFRAQIPDALALSS